MPLKKLFVSSSFVFFLSGCLHPIKPVVEICIPDVPASESICGFTGKDALTNVDRFPIQKVDKATCFPPEEWKKVKDYYDLLEVYVTQLEKNCK